jgi:hypothetical protein
MDTARLARLGLLLAATASPVAAQTVNFDPGTTYTASGIVTHEATGALMNGMKVTAYFANNTSSSGVWGSLGGGYSGVSTGLFTIGIGSGTDTFWAPWDLENHSSSGMTRLVLEGGDNGGVAFDQGWGFWGMEEGTPGSDIGRDYLNCVEGLLCLFTFDHWNTTATYRNAIGIDPNAPVGDLYTTLDLSFGTAFAKGKKDQWMKLDTDIVSATVTPEPATVALLGTGLLALGGFAARRRRADG